MAKVKNTPKKKEKGGPTKGEISRRRCPPASSPTSSAVVGNHVPGQGSNTPAPAPRPTPSEEVIVIDPSPPRAPVSPAPDAGQPAPLQPCSLCQVRSVPLPLTRLSMIFVCSSFTPLI